MAIRCGEERPTYYVASYGWKGGGPMATFVSLVPGEAEEAATEAASRELAEWREECFGCSGTCPVCRLGMWAGPERATEEPLCLLHPRELEACSDALAAGGVIRLGEGRSTVQNTSEERIARCLARRAEVERLRARFQAARRTA